MKYQLISSATMPVNKTVIKEALATKKIQITFLSFIVFLAGLPSTLAITLVGELYITELILPVLALFVVLFKKTPVLREKIFWQFVLAGLCMILGYVATDLVAGTEQSKYLRAWGRNLILVTDLISLAIIFSADKRLLWWFLLGMAVGAIANLILIGTPITEWKIGYGRPAIWLTLLLTSLFSFRISLIGLVALAVVSVFLDSRSMSAMCLIVAGIIFLRLKKPDGLKLSASAIIKIVVTILIMLTLLSVLLSQTEDEYSDRRETSSSGRFAALSVGVIAISDSPILGHGSWGHGTEKYADMIYKELLPKMRALGRDRTWEKSTIFRPHSQILQVWIEGGLFAAAFFILFGYRLVLSLKEVVLDRQLDYFTPLYSFLLVLSTWNLIMSPYGGNHRLPIALSISIICILALDRKVSKA